MGRGSNRLTKKVLRRRSQRKLKGRIKKRAEATRKARGKH